MRPLYYDFNGRPYEGTLEEIIRAWGENFEKPERILKQETMKNGKWISTVWLGMDHSFVVGRPLIYETMVFSNNKSGHDLDMMRYSTREEALKGHEALKKKWQKSKRKNI